MVERRKILLTPAVGLLVAVAAIIFTEGTGKSANFVLFSGQTALPNLIHDASEFTVGTLIVLIVCKGIAYMLSLSSFRGGPIFPGMFIGGALGMAMSHLPGLPMIGGWRSASAP